MARTIGRATTTLLILLVRVIPGYAAPKTDVVELGNGDRVTCEIRKLERGKLTVKTDGIGTIAIEWDDVERPQPAGGAGPRILRILSQSYTTVVSALGGLAFTREKYSGAEDDSVAEAVAGLSWEWFTFDGRSTNLDVGALSFWALNHDARVRLELNTSFKSDIVGDLYWSINLFDSYNSQPPAGRKNNDFGVSAAVGWSF